MNPNYDHLNLSRKLKPETSSPFLGYLFFGIFAESKSRFGITQRNRKQQLDEAKALTKRVKIYWMD